ncbi:substrate-binding periplasmic protein [Bowmanella dokdonensis]|uniref:Transporter substrate-binding domain-containing protein n=1 Tax=Bowmanella dokdonensis TaxID=751969 RepID=A0A939DQ54_9ALTE|nr:transporter substrate-binding domain-containing protein [Bowmanella dokdonensis]MBN7826923.1 transporter substrate-binding domain-containing protein [Bowmanella dokdonensis]
MIRRILLALLLAGGAEAQPPTVTFVSEDLPPFHYLDEHKRPTGAIYELAMAIGHQAGLPVRFEIHPWARAHELSLHQPNVIMASLLRSPVREQSFHWLGQVFVNKPFLVALSERDPLTIDSLEQAKKYIVGTIRGYTSEGYLRSHGFSEEQGNLVLSVEYHQLWGLLFKKRIDLVMTNTLAMRTEVSDAGFQPAELKRVFALEDFPGEIHLAASKLTPVGTVEKLRNALQALKDQGQYRQIMQKWALHEELLSVSGSEAR